MRLVMPANPQERSPYDNMFLKDFDPERDGMAPNGRITMAHITATHNPAEAMHFPDIPTLLAKWKQTCKRDPIRQDGEPNRYLTYWTINIEVYETHAPD